MGKTLFLMLFGILVFSLFAVQVQATEFIPAVDTHLHYDRTIAPLGHWYVAFSSSNDKGMYGSFVLTDGSDITFFICDEANYNKYDAGESFSAYEHQADVTSGSFKKRLSSDITWYFVLGNKDSLLYTQTVSIDIYTDRTAPAITINLDTGSTYGGIKEIVATANDASFSVWKLSLQYYSNGWQTVKTVYSTESISYNWDTKDWNNIDVRWRAVAEDTLNNEGTKEVMVTVYNYGAPTTNPTPTSPNYPQFETFLIGPIMFVFGVIVLVGIGWAYSRRSKKDETFGPSPKMKPKDKPAPDDTTSRAIERTTVEKIVLIICPYCGARNEQGILQCQKCKADL